MGEGDKGREQERGRDRLNENESFVCWFTARMAEMGVTGLGQSKEPRTSSRSPTRMASNALTKLVGRELDRKCNIWNNVFSLIWDASGISHCATTLALAFLFNICILKNALNIQNILAKWCIGFFHWQINIDSLEALMLPGDVSEQLPPSVYTQQVPLPGKLVSLLGLKSSLRNLQWGFLGVPSGACFLVWLSPTGL